MIGKLMKDLVAGGYLARREDRTIAILEASTGWKLPRRWWNFPHRTYVDFT